MLTNRSLNLRVTVRFRPGSPASALLSRGGCRAEAREREGGPQARYELRLGFSHAAPVLASPRGRFLPGSPLSQSSALNSLPSVAAATAERNRTTMGHPDAARH